MRKLFALFVFFLSGVLSLPTYALLNLELTRGVAGAIPIAVMPFDVQGVPPQDVSAIVAHDLQMSGRFKVRNTRDGSDNIVMGSVQDMGGGRYVVQFKLLEAFKNKDAASPSVLLSRQFTVSTSELRSVSHHISDLIYQHMTGVKGVFSTRLAYVVVQRSASARITRYILEVSDMDGYNPRALLTSPEPIMSPAWSPNGREIAYVSFEKKHAAIYIQNAFTGQRRLLSEFVGINGAPAWSPDGKKLTVVLSKEGSPNIYIMDLIARRLTQITHDWSINTEPAWSPDGNSIVFTSNRSGGSHPQIYQKNLVTGTVTRLTYDGDYNARASFTRDGNHIVMLNKESRIFNIGILDLNTGVFRVLTTGGIDNESPSIAPNGSMVLYGTLNNGRGVLGMVATDGSIELRLPVKNGEVQDPAWSPFLV